MTHSLPPDDKDGATMVVQRPDSLTRQALEAVFDQGKLALIDKLVSAEGRSIEVQRCCFARVRKGRVAEYWIVVEQLRGLQQLGLATPIVWALAQPLLQMADVRPSLLWYAK